VVGLAKPLVSFLAGNDIQPDTVERTGVPVLALCLATGTLQTELEFDKVDYVVRARECACLWGNLRRCWAGPAKCWQRHARPS
jgi:hypothetical protein